jgi:hypothetical protein
MLRKTTNNIGQLFKPSNSRAWQRTGLHDQDRCSNHNVVVAAAAAAVAVD